MDNKKLSEEQINKMWEEYKKLLLSVKRPGIEELVGWLDGSDFKVAPASTRFHSCYPGGLMEHSLTVYKEAIRQKELIKLFNVPKDTLIITALLHDICKVNYYEWYQKNEKINGQWVPVDAYKVNDFLPIGHAEKSIIIAQQFIKLNEIEIAMIRNHMGAFKDDPTNVSLLFNKYPESLIIHIADMIATYIIESPGMLEDFKENLEEYMKNY